MLSDLENIGLEQRLELVRSRIGTALFHLERTQDDVTLIAVGKGHSTESIRALHRLGVRDFAENYAQEYLRKREELADLNDVRWHFIGRLQSNKAKKIVQSGCLIHSVDRESLIDEICKAASPAQPARILIQMQVDAEDTNKSGCPMESAAELCASICQNPSLSWEGFMGIGPAEQSSERLNLLYARFIRKAQSLWEEHSLRDPSRELRPMKLSLGMSDDLEIAIRNGANLIRIGSALFGPRPKKVQAT